MRLRPLLLVLGLLLALAMFSLSGLSTETKFHLHFQGALHPWLHLCGFALLAALLSAALRRPALQLLACAALLLFAYGTEAHESHLDGWPVEQKDVLTDAAGILAGIALASRPRSSHPERTGRSEAR